MRTAKVLTPDVRIWMRSHPEAAELFLSELRHQWHAELPSSYEELVRNSTIGQLEHWSRRSLYVRRLDEVFDPAWRIPAELVDRADLIRRAIADPLRLWALALSFIPSEDRKGDRRFVEQVLPWFGDLRQTAGVWLELRKGLAVLGCEDDRWAQDLFSSIRRFPGDGKRLTAQLFTQEGRRAAG